MWTVEARERANRKVVQVCVECGDEFEVCVKHRTRKVRCEACQEAREEVYNAVWCREYRERLREAHQVRNLNPYRVVVDPEGLWGWDCELEYGAWRDLLRLGYVEVGTVLERVRTGQRYEVVEVNRALRLREVVLDGLLRVVTGSGGG